ncbi:MAG: hypothetical protein ACFE85_05400 [Candidatus Hodarchaeota archaeon]
MRLEINNMRRIKLRLIIIREYVPMSTTLIRRSLVRVPHTNQCCGHYGHSFPVSSFI